MNHKNLIINVLDTTFDKESWFAPQKNAIEGITAEQASWRPTGEAAQTIWEIVNHLIYYKERLVANLEGIEWTNHLDGDDTFYLTKQSNEEKEWTKVVERAEKAHRKLKKILIKTSVGDFDNQSFEGKLLDIFLHDAYHTGQIIQLRKLQGSWPSQR